MSKFLKKLLGEQGISGAIVALLLVLVGVAVVFGIKGYLDTSKNTIQNSITNEITNVTGE